MRRLIYLFIFVNFLLISMPGNSYCYAADSKLELEWEYLIPHENDRNLNTSSLHILKKISETNTRSVYRGITITRAQGDISFKEQNHMASSAVGIGPIYMVRNEKYRSGKLSVAIDMSGGFMIYNKVFPAGGKCYNFMWRLGPQFIYKINETSSINVGYMLMHVSNAFKNHNPSYNAHGLTFGFSKTL